MKSSDVLSIMDPNMGDNNVKTTFSHWHSKNTYMGLIKRYYYTSLYMKNKRCIHMAGEIIVAKYDLLKDVQKFPTLTETFVFKTFEMYERNGKDILILKRQTPEDPVIEVLSFEDIFEVLMNIHVMNNHSTSRDFLMSATKDRYTIPGLCCDLVQESCNFCQEEGLPPQATLTDGRRGKVLFLKKVEVRKNTYFSSLMVYIDEDTEFTVLRPLHSLTSLEIAMELFKIFMEFGPPESTIINSTFQTSVTEEIKEIMQKLCPQCKITLSNNDSFIGIQITSALSAWMKDNKSTLWELGCFLIQNDLNTKIKPIIRLGDVHKIKGVDVTAHELFFKTPSIYYDQPKKYKGDSEIDDEKKRNYKPAPSSRNKLAKNKVDVTENEVVDEEPLVYVIKSETIDNDPLASLNTDHSADNIMNIEKLNILGEDLLPDKKNTAEKSKKLSSNAKKQRDRNKGRPKKSFDEVYVEFRRETKDDCVESQSQSATTKKDKNKNLNARRSKRLDHLLNLKAKTTDIRSCSETVEISENEEGEKSNDSIEVVSYIEQEENDITEIYRTINKDKKNQTAKQIGKKRVMGDIEEIISTEDEEEETRETSYTVTIDVEEEETPEKPVEEDDTSTTVADPEKNVEVDKNEKKNTKEDENVTVSIESEDEDDDVDFGAAI